MTEWEPIALAALAGIERSERASHVFLVEGDPALLRRASHGIANRVLRRLARDDSLALAKHASGQPYVPGLDIGISLSHSGGCLLVALGDASIGVDIESLRHPAKWRDVYDWITTPAERSPDPTPDDFLFSWTAKEALLKSAGIGLDYGLARLTLPADAREPAEVHGRRYWLHPLPRWKTMAACAALGGEGQVHTHYLIMPRGALA